MKFVRYICVGGPTPFVDFPRKPLEDELVGIAGMAYRVVLVNGDDTVVVLSPVRKTRDEDYLCGHCRKPLTSAGRCPETPRNGATVTRVVIGRG